MIEIRHREQYADRLACIGINHRVGRGDGKFGARQQHADGAFFSEHLPDQLIDDSLGNRCGQIVAADAPCAVIPQLKMVVGQDFLLFLEVGPQIRLASVGVADGGPDQ